MSLTRIKGLFCSNNSLLMTVHMKIRKHLKKISFLFYIMLYNCSFFVINKFSYIMVRKFLPLR